MKFWTVEFENGVVTASYYYPPKNYMHPDGVMELSELIDEWRKPEYRVVILRSGHGSIFSTHFDGESLSTMDPGEVVNCLNLGYSAIEFFNNTLRKLQKLNKPVIACMNGDAMGGGFELSASCDIRIGQRGDYRYGLPETRWGYIPGGGGTQRLSRLFGVSVATNMILRGMMYKPEEALAVGIIHELADDATAEAKKIAADLAKRPVIGLARAKAMIYEGYEMSLDAGIAMENFAFMDTVMDPELQKHVAEYLGKEPDDRRDFLEYEM